MRSGFITGKDSVTHQFAHFRSKTQSAVWNVARLCPNI